MPGLVGSKQTKPLPMPTVPTGGPAGSGMTGTKYQGGIGQPGGMIPPPRNGGTPGFPNPRPTGPNVPSPRPIKGGGMVGDLQPGRSGNPLGPVMGGGKFAMRPAQGSMGQPRPRPMLRPGMGMT